MLKAVAKILMKLKTTAVIEGLGEIKPTPDPLELIITMPTEAQEIEEGESVSVQYTLSGDLTGLDKVAIKINGVEVDSIIEAPFDGGFVLDNLTAGFKLIEVVAYVNGQDVAEDSVSIEITEPLTVAITSPTELAEFDEGEDVTVSFLLGGNQDGLSKVSVQVDGVEIDSHTSSPYGGDFTLTDLTTGAKEISILAYIDGEIAASDSVDIVINEVIIPLELTIASPIKLQEFDEGENIVVSFSFNRAAPEVTKTELWVNGSLAQTDSTPPFPVSFVIEDAAVGNMEIEVLAFEGAELLAADAVDVVVNAVADPLLLDIYPNQFGESWSLQQINSNFNTNILELRSDDNDTMSVMFDAGELPLAAIAAWAGSGKAYVTRWDGQSGNGLFVQQTNAVNQPWIYDNGFTLEGGKPSMIFVGNQYLDGGDILGVVARPLISFVVGQGVNDYFYAKSIAGAQEQRYGLFYQSGSTLSVLHPKGGSPNNISYAHTNSRKIISQMVIPNVEHKVFENNVEKGSVSPLSGDGLVGDSDYDFLIGAYNDGNGSANPPYACLNGTIQAIHIYLNDVSAQRSAITTEIMNRYGIS